MSRGFPFKASQKMVSTKQHEVSDGLGGGDLGWHVWENLPGDAILKWWSNHKNLRIPFSCVVC